MKTLKLLAVLLSYPSAELVDALPELAQRLNAEPRCAARRGCARRLLAELKREDLLDLQERYVAAVRHRPRDLAAPVRTCTATRATAARRSWT